MFSHLGTTAGLDTLRGAGWNAPPVANSFSRPVNVSSCHSRKIGVKVLALIQASDKLS